MASDSVRSGPTNYEDSTPEWASDTFAYRSPHKNLFLRFAYPRVKNRISYVERYRRAYTEDHWLQTDLRFDNWALFSSTADIFHSMRSFYA